MKIDFSAENISLNEDALKEFEMLKQLVEELSPKNEQLITFIIISIVLLVINAIIGIVVEVVDTHRGKKEHKRPSTGSGNGNAIPNNVQEQV